MDRRISTWVREGSKDGETWVSLQTRRACFAHGIMVDQDHASAHGMTALRVRRLDDEQCAPYPQTCMLNRP